ncbi:MAG: NAD-binding protein [Enhygromyxa sp.]
MSKKPSLADRYRYAFDALMARGAWALITWHLLIVLAAVLLVTLLAVVLGAAPVDEDGEAMSFAALFWSTLMHALDPGTIAEDDQGGVWRTLMLSSTVFGILLLGSVLGVLVTGVTDRFEQLREGRSRVLESDHTLIVGWSRQVFTIVSELAVANQSRGGSCIVIYADHPKVWMEDELRTKVRDTGRTRVVLRSGDPTDPETLEVVAPEHARAIVVLAPEGSGDDTEVVRALLSVGRTRPAEGVAQHVVTEIRDPRNAAVARLAVDRRTEVLEIGDLVAKIAVQTCLQAGLSVVYEELLSFNGHEIYFVDASAPLIGRDFGHALQQFDDCTLLGLRGRDGRVVLNPPMDRVIEAGEQAIVIAFDNVGIELRPWSGALDEAAMVASPSSSKPPERILILGWNSRVPAIVAGIDAYVSAGSEVLVVSREGQVAAELEALDDRLEQLTIAHRVGDVSARRVIDELDPRAWDHVMVLPPDRNQSATQADAQVLVALLHLRDLAEELDRPFSVVSEMRDARSRDLAEVARADDFIISDRLIGLLLAQVAEHADLAAVFAELFDPAGAEIYLRPATDYVVEGREVEVRTLVEVGRRRGEVVIGVRVAADAHEASKNFGISVNPRKSRKVRLSAADRVIVLAT